MIRAWLFVIVSCLAIVACDRATAQTVTGNGIASAYPSSTAGNSTTFQDLIARAENVKRFGVAVDTTGKLNTTTNTRLPNGTTVAVGGTIPKLAAVGAIARFATGPLGLLLAGKALYDLADELDYKLTNPTGVLVVEKKDPTICSVAPCVVWGTSRTISTGTPYYPTKLAACQATSAGYYAQWPSEGVNTIVSYTGNSCITRSANMGYDYNTAYGQSTVAPSPAVTTPSTLEEFTDAVAAKSGWPSTSALARATVAAIQAGQEVTVEPGAVSGPATSPGPVTTSTDAAGNVTTKTTTNNYTYNTNNVTTNQTTVTTVFNSSTGITTTDGTTTGPAPETPPKDQCAEHPDTAGCASLDTPEGEIPRTTATVTYSAENPFGTGSCPANLTANVGTLGHSITVWDWSKTCELALPLRALVISLATFAAFLIVMPFKVDT